jgi:predicted DNA-binding transcriptional regulator AlpA
MPNRIASKEPPNVTDAYLTAAPEAGNVIEVRARRMLNEKRVLAIVGVGHTTLWRMVKKGQFPKPTFVSANRCIWFEDVILAWQNESEGQGRAAASLKP